MTPILSALWLGATVGFVLGWSAFAILSRHDDR